MRAARLLQGNLADLRELLAHLHRNAVFCGVDHTCTKAHRDGSSGGDEKTQQSLSLERNVHDE